MSDNPGSLEEALKSTGPHTVTSLSARLADFGPAAIAEALDALAAAGVLRKEDVPGQEPQYHYVAPERYGLINVPVVKLPGADFGRRG